MEISTYVHCIDILKINFLIKIKKIKNYTRLPRKKPLFIWTSIFQWSRHSSLNAFARTGTRSFKDYIYLLSGSYICFSSNPSSHQPQRGPMDWQSEHVFCRSHSNRSVNKKYIWQNKKDNLFTHLTCIICICRCRPTLALAIRKADHVSIHWNTSASARTPPVSNLILKFVNHKMDDITCIDSRYTSDSFVSKNTGSDMWYFVVFRYLMKQLSCLVAMLEQWYSEVAQLHLLLIRLYHPLLEQLWCAQIAFDYVPQLVVLKI